MNPTSATKRIRRIFRNVVDGYRLSIEDALFANYHRPVYRTHLFCGEKITLWDGSVLITRDGVWVVCPANARYLPTPNLPRRAVVGPTWESLYFYPASRLVLRNECILVCSPEAWQEKEAECALWNSYLSTPFPKNAFRKFSCLEELAIFCELEGTPQ